MELREQLSRQKKLFQDQTDKKRTQNVKQKSEKQSILKEKLKAIQAMRQESAQIHKGKREEKIKAIEDQHKRQLDTREKSLLEVHSKIMRKKEDKQQESERIAKELREIQLKRQYLNANKVSSLKQTSLNPLPRLWSRKKPGRACRKVLRDRSRSSRVTR